VQNRALGFRRIRQGDGLTFCRGHGRASVVRSRWKFLLQLAGPETASGTDHAAHLRLSEAALTRGACLQSLSYGPRPTQVGNMVGPIRAQVPFIDQSTPARRQHSIQLGALYGEIELRPHWRSLIRG